MPTRIRNLKNQKLRRKGTLVTLGKFKTRIESLCQQSLTYSAHVWPPEGSSTSVFRPVVLKLQYKPILDGGSVVLAAAHSDHDEREEEEEAGHGKAHAVHWLVAYDYITVHAARYGRAACTETRNLMTQKHTEIVCEEILRDTGIKLGQIGCFGLSFNDMIGSSGTSGRKITHNPSSLSCCSNASLLLGYRLMKPIWIIFLFVLELEMKSQMRKFSDTFFYYSLYPWCPCGSLKLI